MSATNLVTVSLLLCMMQLALCMSFLVGLDCTVANILIFHFSYCETCNLEHAPNTVIKTSCDTLPRVSYHKQIICKSSYQIKAERE